MSELNLTEGRYIVTYGILNNSLIQLEKADNTNEYLLMLFKYNMYKVLRFQGKDENAQICLAQAAYIAQKYGIDFTFDTDESHFIPLIDPDAEDNILMKTKGFGEGSLADLEETEERNKANPFTSNAIPDITDENPQTEDNNTEGE